jgi:hypothetical protein
MSFVAVPLKAQKAKMVTTLHSIALMDSSFSRVSGPSMYKIGYTNKKPGCCEETRLASPTSRTYDAQEENRVREH